MHCIIVWETYTSFWSRLEPLAALDGTRCPPSYAITFGPLSAYLKRYVNSVLRHSVVAPWLLECIGVVHAFAAAVAFVDSTGHVRRQRPKAVCSLAEPQGVRRAVCFGLR